MNLERLTKRVMQELDGALTDELSSGKKDEIMEIVHRAMSDASARTHREMKETAVIACGPEADLAHKIQEEMDKKRDMLIANLSAMT